MPRFAANLTLLFCEVPFLERFERAAMAGFEAVEFQLPYAFDAMEIRHQLDCHRLTAVLHNLPAGHWDLGERGIACLPDRVDEFREGVQQGIAYAKVLGVPRLNCLSGIAPAQVDDAALHQTLVSNLQFTARALSRAGLQLLVEPINTFDIAGFYLHSTEQAIKVLDEVDADNALLQYDVYHAQRMEGELAQTLTRLLPRIGHIQIADNPGRHEPGTGEINFPFLLDHLDRLGYSGWVGCEYHPATTTEAGLVWRHTLMRSTA